MTSEAEILETFFTTNNVTPSQPFKHRCTPLCKLYRLPGTDDYVCTETFSVHQCGRNCNRGIASRDNEGMVCPLTGIVVGDIFPVICAPGAARAPGQINCVLSTVVRRSQTNFRGDNSAIRRYVEQALKAIFHSTKRKELQEKKQERVCKFIKRELRKGTDYSTINASLIQREFAFLNFYQVTNELLEVLKNKIEQIVRYWAKFSLRPLRKVIYTFVGAVISLLGTGKIVQGVSLFEKSIVISYAQPDESDLGPLLGISCRNITKMIKYIVNESLHCDGIPKPEFIFSNQYSNQANNRLVALGPVKKRRRKYQQ